MKKDREPKEWEIDAWDKDGNLIIKAGKPTKKLEDRASNKEK